MNVRDLNAEIARCGLTIPKLAKLTGIDKKRLYSRMREETSFKQSEIVSISKALKLSNDKIISIFFADLVS